jgi:hypothetical protein
VQATVLRFETTSRSGTAATDPGRIVAFDATAFEIGGLLLLRPGQRVRLVLEADRCTCVTLATFAPPPTAEG